MPRVWFVTGSSRGLGRAIVQHALERGDRVVATAREPEQLDDLVAQHADRVKPVALDVTDAAQADQAVHEAVEAFGRLDIVVNNAGYGDIAAVEDVDLEDFRRQIDTDFYGVVYVTKAVLPILREQGSGHIFQISSLSARIGGVGLAAYQSAKWAVSGFSTGVAEEVAPFGVAVTTLEPSGIATDWAGSSMTIPPISEPYRQTVGAFAEMVRDTSGSEPINVAKVAQVVADLAGRADAPVRLLLGADAVRYARDAAEQLAASDAKWRAVSASTVVCATMIAARKEAGCDKKNDADQLQVLGRSIVDRSMYMVLATADGVGRPWATPVYFVSEEYRGFVWVSRPDARHSRNLAERPEVGITIFDSSAPISTGRAVYITATGLQLEGDERIAAVAAFSHRAVLDGGRPWELADLERPEGVRIYRATAVEQHVNDDLDRRVPVTLWPSRG